jgi:hypothetical protein
MPKEVPDHHDAELILRVYELRREAVMRESRNAINGKFWPRSYDDVKAISQPDDPLNAAFRQVGTYWEMVYGMVRHGVVHAEYFLESNGEGLLLFAKLLPHLEEFRRDFAATAFRNAEWVARETETGRALVERFQGRVKAKLEALAR